MNGLLHTKKGMIAAGAVGLVAVLAAGWLLMVSPKRQEADELAVKVASSQEELARKRAELARPSLAVRVKANDLYRLSKALPGEVDTAGVLLDLDRLSKRHGLTLWSLTPAAPIAGVGVLQRPYDVTLEGRFTDVSRFLRDVRKLVGVKRGRLTVAGRAYSIDQLELAESETGAKFPIVAATLTVNAYSFSGPPPADDGTAPTTTTTTSTESVAAGATP